MPDQKMAKAGEKITAKAATKLRKDFPRMFREGNPKDYEVQPKTTDTTGQWACADCGRFFENNMMTQMHAKSHRRVWWNSTRCQFEEA